MSKRLSLSMIFGLFVLFFTAAILTVLPIRQASAWGEEVTIVRPESEWLTKEYMDVYQLKPNTHFSYSSSHPSYGGYELAKAFDGDFNTAYICMKAVDSTTYPNIEVNFKQTATIDRIIYKCKDYDGAPSGFPYELKLWYWNGSSSDSVTIENYSATSDIIVYKFAQPITVTRIRLDFVSVSVTNNSVSNSFAVPTAAEIMILQPENDYVDIVSNLFADYRWTEIKKEYATQAFLDELKSALGNHANYQSDFLPRIERAEGILNGTVVYDKTREFTTDGEGLNKIDQFGNIVSYARNTLMMQYLGTNKQVTGIYQNAKKVITIWVEADEGVPLPGINIAQFYNYFDKYHNNFTLQRGRNVITVPDVANGEWWDMYKNHTVSGGSVYITNPYTPAEQPGGVKVYIEGGYTYPVMSYHTTSAEYLAELSKYSALVKANPDEFADITELVCDHAFLTVSAATALKTYPTKKDPHDVLVQWDALMEDMLTFDGVTFDKDAEHYDERNEHLNINVRLSQPVSGASAYSSPEIIGLPNWVENAMVVSLGWGITHEIGHTIDMPTRMISETTNNVPTKYFVYTHGGDTHGSFGTIRNSLTSDLNDTSDFWKGHTGFWEFWWNIESVFPGYWAKLENLYRYGNKQNISDKTELMVYFSSLATEQDMSYYFERWGFNLNNYSNPFKYENASANFKNVMQQARTEGKFGDKQYKLWYVNNDTYKYVAMDKGASIYTSADKPSISSVVAVGGGYKLILPASSNSAHYGYEIWEGSEASGYKVIGFTEGDTYIDATPYENGYVPSYKIVAYDKTLKCSSLSEAAASEVSASPVCRLNNGMTYGSLQQAVYAANAGDVIYLLDDVWEYDISITVNLTITIAEGISKDITITKGSNGVLFDVRSGASLILQGSAAYKLILDGDSYGGGPLISVNGATLNASNVKFMNCESSGEGGAIAAYSGTLTLNNCDFENCVASDGGAIYADSTTVTITACNFDDCHAQESNASGFANGGAIYLANCGSKAVTISSSTITGCSAQGNGGQSISNGGALYVENCANVTIGGTTISGCEANFGGAIYLKNATVTIQNNCNINGCSATDGGAFYLTDSSTLTIDASTLTGNTANDNGGAIYVASADSALSVTGLSKLTTNTATYGGAIASVGTIIKILGNGSSFSDNMTISTNQAQYGGAIAVLGGGRIELLQYTMMQGNTAEYGGAIYLEGSAYIYDSVTIRDSVASKMGGAIYYKGDEDSELKFDASVTSAMPLLSNDSAPIGYELYMESGNLVMLSVKFNFNYAMADRAPSDEEMKYSLYVNRGNVEIAGYAGEREQGAAYNEASLARDIFISSDATIKLTGGMFIISETYVPTDPPVFMQYITEQFLRIALDRYDYDCVKVLFTADFDIPEDALDMISLKNTEYGNLEIRGRTICFVPNEVTLTVDFGGEAETISRKVETGSTYMFTAEGFASETKYIAGFLVNGVTYHLGDTITIDDATYVEVILADKYKVTVTFGGEEIVSYLIPGETFTFEATCSLVQEGTIVFWLYNGERYEIGDTVQVAENAVIMPVLEGMVKVEFYVGEALFDVTYAMLQEQLTLPYLTDTAEGYEVYWLAGGERYKAGEEVTITGEARFVAQLVKIKLTVSYYNQGELIESISVEYGDEIVLRDFFEPEEGYTLVGWTIDGVDYGADKTITVTENVEVIIKVEKITFTVAYYYHGELIESVSVEYGDEITLPSSIELEEGDTLIGWKAGAESYDKGEKVTVTSDMAFYAVTESVSEPPAQTPDDNKGTKWGCGSVITASPAVMGGILVVAAAVVLTKKKSKK